MKIMVASDIHGSAFRCRMLMERFEAENPDRLLLLGDLTAEKLVNFHHPLVFVL